MKRYNNFNQRPDYVKQLEDIGFNYWNLPSGPDNLPYYQEGVVYALSETEIDRIQHTTQELHDMCIEVVEAMVSSGDYPDYFGLDTNSISAIEQSWKRGDPSLYGRFDLAFGQQNELKLLEYNGDTPVSILECSVAQWDYISQLSEFPKSMQPEFGKYIPDAMKIQYNSIDETMIETWQRLFEPNTLLHFCASGGFRHEDWGNLLYVMDNAFRAGMRVKDLQMEDIGVTADGHFVDLQDRLIDNAFKLYPWEWMLSEQFGSSIKTANTKWLEPAWKLLLSNKALLVKLWEMFPHHPNLLPAFVNKPSTWEGKFCKKNIHGREGANIYIVDENGERLGEGSHIVPEYNKWDSIYQQWLDVKQHDGYYPNIGSWIIGDKACGMSIRESRDVITGMDSFFASHLFVPYDLEEKFKKLWTN